MEDASGLRVANKPMVNRDRAPLDAMTVGYQFCWHGSARGYARHAEPR